jgi:hypothetical protein
MVIVNELKSVKPKRLKDLNNKEFKLRAWVIVPPFVKKPVIVAVAGLKLA